MDRVLIIDDDRMVQNILQRSLVDHYEVRAASDGSSGIELAESWHPDMILLDVEMPGQNGYEVCDSLKQRESTAEIPVIFLSSCSSLRERMLGFEVGAEDYLVKPCSPELLHAKLRKINETVHERAVLKRSADDATQTAMEAMSTSFELGKAVRYIERSYACSSFDKLGSELMEVMADLGLKACAMFLTQGDDYFFSSTTNEVTPIEIDLMGMLHGEQRFIDFGCRTQLNYPHASLLIKNMPLEDRSSYGRLKDTLPFIMGATDAKVKVLDAEQALNNQHQKLCNSIIGIEEAVKGFSSSLSKSQAEVSNIMLELTSELNLKIHALGLDYDQEEFIAHRIDAAGTKLHICLNEERSVKEDLGKVIDRLNSLGEDQQRVIQESLSSASRNEPDVGNDVELF